MIIVKAYKTKLRPTPEQVSIFAECGNVARYVYNWALADRKNAYEQRSELVNHYEQKRRFNAIKTEACPWVTAVPYVVTESAFANLDVAYRNFFRRVRTGGEKPGFPRFKRKDEPRRFTLRGSITVESDRVKLPKIGWITLAEVDYLPVNPHKLLSATVSERGKDWYISIQVEMDVEVPERPEGDPIGVDFGYGYLATTSDGKKFENPAILEKNKKKLTKLQRKLARQKKGSKNREKTKQKIATLHAKIADTRAHHVHNTSREIVDNKAAILAVQKLAVSDMMQDKSRESKYAKRAKKLADAATAELRRQIEYKQTWAGGEIRVGETSDASNRRCSSCGHINDSVPINKESFVCSECGTLQDRRINGAKNALHYAGL